MNFYTEPLDDLFEHFGVDPQKGLNQAQLEQAREKYGKNVLREQKKPSLLMRFLAQFKDTMIIILIIAAIISFFVAAQSGETREFLEPALILAIVILNAIMGMMQESKAEKAMEALKSMSAPHARVLRNGREAVIDASDLVPGDIILVEAGDFVPADARLIESASLKSEESALTGESVPVEKDAQAAVAEGAPLGDRVNMLYSGCSVTYGRGRAIVTGTGMDTEMGRIAGLLESADDTQTPLQHKLARMGKLLGIVALAACAVIFVIGLLNNIPVLEIFMTSVSLAVSAIPEGLPAIVTVVLSIGIQRMAKKNAIIRRLPAVETLGSASIICSDKTGTLTQNRMTLTRAYAVDGRRTEEISANCSDAVRQLLSMATLCCDGSIEMENGKEKHIGDPTETAIVAAAAKNGITKAALNRKYPRLTEIPFDSDRKLMTTVHKIDGGYIAIVKGAFDVIEDRCVKGGCPEEAEDIVNDMSQQALRVLAVATKKLDKAPENPTPEELENGLTLIGLVGMIDPPRPEVREAVKICRKAGITPVMITGDHVVTAAAIARELGILVEGNEAMTGAELASLSDEELAARVRNISVYARVSPEDKIRIVRAADIGCAMGITGTDVAKGAADMTLTDDNFTTIVDAVREGRGIYDNIKKVVGFLLGTNIGEILCVFFAMILWHRTPLLSMQLLLINLATDSLPAIALGMEAVEKDVMEHKPRPRSEGLFAKGYGLQIALQGLMFGALTLIAYWIGEHQGGSEQAGQTMAFLVLALSQVVQAFNMRSTHSLFKIGPFTNHKLNWAALASFALVLLVSFVPLVRDAFELVLLPTGLYLWALALILFPIVAMEAAKALDFIKHRH